MNRRALGYRLTVRQWWAALVAGCVSLGVLVGLGVFGVLSSVDARHSAEVRADQALSVAQRSLAGEAAARAAASRRVDLLNERIASLQAEVSAVLAARGNEAQVQAALGAATAREQAIGRQEAASAPAAPITRPAPPSAPTPTTAPPRTTTTTTCAAALLGRCVLP